MNLPAEASFKENSEHFHYKIQNLLKKKKLNETIFDWNQPHIPLEADINIHVAWLFRFVYSVAYPGHYSKEGIARFYHGITHVTRAATYITAFINLYRRFDDLRAYEFTETEVRLIIIAVLVHDSARESEEKDLWDLESATFTFFYCTRILRLNTETSKTIAEAMANKDWYADKYYFELRITEDDEVEWLKTMRTESKTLFHELIQNVDCLDILRARDDYDVTRLDSYQKISQSADPKLCKNVFSELKLNARSLIKRQGDERNNTNAKIKSLYENINAYQLIKQDILDCDNLLKNLFAVGCLLSKEELSKITLVDPTNIFYQQHVLARGMLHPTAFTTKDPGETLATKEFRKQSRRPGIPTRTPKTNYLEKNGNPRRSVSLIGHGAGVFADAGGLILNVDYDAIETVSEIDKDTGWGKKKLKHNSVMDCNNVDDDSTTAYDKVCKLEDTLKLRTPFRYFEKHKIIANHSEILYTLKEFDALYFTNEKTFIDDAFHRNVKDSFYKIENYKPPYAPLLKAIFIQNEHQKFFPGKILPIYEYSPSSGSLKLHSPISDEQIIDMWSSMCVSFMLQGFYDGDPQALMELYTENVENIKIFSMYSNYMDNTDLYAEIGSADSNYGETLQSKITEKIEQEKNLIFQKWMSMANINKSELKQIILEKVELNLDINSIIDDLLLNEKIDFRIKILEKLLKCVTHTKYMEIKSKIQKAVNTCIQGLSGVFPTSDIDKIKNYLEGTVKGINHLHKLFLIDKLEYVSLADPTHSCYFLDYDLECYKIPVVSFFEKMSNYRISQILKNMCVQQEALNPSNLNFLCFRNKYNVTFLFLNEFFYSKNNDCIKPFFKSEGEDKNSSDTKQNNNLIRSNFFSPNTKRQPAPILDAGQNMMINL